MGEIFHALEVLNRTMKLGLSGQDLLRAEMGFKSALAMQGNPAQATTKLAGDPGALAERYELVTQLRPRSAKLSLNQLSALANQAVKTPRTRVAAATFRKVDTAIAAASRATVGSGLTRGAIAGTRLTASAFARGKSKKKRARKRK